MSGTDILNKISSCISRMDQEEISLKEFIEGNGVKAVTDVDLKTGVDRLIYNHAMNKTQLAKVCKMSIPTFNALEKKLLDEGAINESFVQGKSNMYNRFDAKTFMDRANIEKYSDFYKPIVIPVVNHKGGVGKSTVTRSMATGFALDTSLNARVLIVDFDPQGSCGLQGQPKKDNDIYLTMADITMRDVKDKSIVDGKEIEQESDFNTYMEMYELTEEEVVLYAAIPTHLPNLSIYSAFPNDERFTDHYHSLDAEGKDKLLRQFSEFVLPILKNEYDIIFIDMPPQDSPITWSAIMGADLMLTPIVPKELDYLSTRNFIKFTRDRIQQLGVDTIKEWKILPVNVDDNSRQQSSLMDRLVRTFTDLLTNNRIDSSELFYAADSIHRTIYDIQKQECIENKYVSKSSYENALMSTNAVKRELIQVVKKLSLKE